MFPYTDPTQGTVLAALGALDPFRKMVDRFYMTFGTVRSSGFAPLEAFDGVNASSATVEWPAFPISVAAPNDAAIDDDRLAFQDEYVEWRVEREAGVVVRITFTTEFSEYFEALAEVGSAALIAGVQDAIPGSTPTIQDLFGPGAPPDTLLPSERAERFRDSLPSNPWNNGTLGILCLTQQINTMGALFNLLGACGIPDLTLPPNAVCATTGGACGPDRNSDPRVCAAAQVSARAAEGLTLADSPGIQILRLGGFWAKDGVPVDINASPAWVISRGGHRGVLTPEGLTLGGAPVVSGAQVSRVLRVGANVLTAPESALPVWARMGNEGPGRVG